MLRRTGVTPLLLFLLLGMAGLSQATNERLRLTHLFHGGGPSQVRDQPNWLQAEATLTEWELCPNNTNYVTRNRGPQRVQNVVGATRSQVLGCIPFNHTACIVPGVSRVLGSCPEGELCTYRAGPGEHDHIRFMGCVDTHSKDCYGTRCSEGYICCPSDVLGKSRCAPHPPGEPNNYHDSCANLHNIVPHMDLPGRLVRPYQVYQSVNKLVNATNITVSGVETIADAEAYICRGSRAKCLLADTCNLLNYTNPSTNLTVLDLGHCCPTGWDLCLRPGADVATSLNADDFVGCANPAMGETCCGASICPDSHRCCANENPLNPGVIADYQCCPVEMECCYGDPSRASIGMDPFLAGDAVPNPFSYCGMSVFNMTCAMDRMAPSHWFPLLRGARSFSTP